MNRLISRLILVFALVSLAMTLVPLLQAGDGRPLVPFLDRGNSLMVYAVFLVGFAFFGLPHFLARDPEPRRSFPWAVVTAYVLVFAAIPLVFSAYISGVSAAGLLRGGALCAACMGVPLMLRRWLPRAALPVALFLGAILCFALPGLLIHRASLGLEVPPALVALSPLHWLHRISALRAVPPAWPFLLLAGLVWAAAVLPRLRVPAAAAALLLVILVPAATRSAPQEVPGATVRSLAGPHLRPGFRLPLEVRLDPADSPAILRIGEWSTEVLADGTPHTVLVIPGPRDRELELRLGSARTVMPLPARGIAAEQALVAVLDTVDTGTLGPPGRVARAPLRSGAVPLADGALEMFDALLVSRAGHDRASPALRAALERYAALGGLLIEVDPQAGSVEQEEVGVGHRLRAAPAALGGIDLRAGRAREASALDSALIRTFAAPRWEEMDLSHLLLFAIVYHVAFLLAFLLPLLLDARKAVGVYLVSVGFVVLAIALLAWNVLTAIFLKDNQVYTQSITLLVQSDEARPRLVGRQFLCFASMSEETRDLAFEPGAGVVPYRPAEGGRPVSMVVGSAGTRLVGLTLDRRQRKSVVRIDRVSPSPFSLQAEPGGGAFRLAPAGTGEDPFGLRGARLEEAVLVEGGSGRRHYRAEGLRLVADGPAAGLPTGREEQLRKLLGRFAPRFERFLLVRLRGLRRPDDEARYLWVRDLGAWLMVPLPGA